MLPTVAEAPKRPKEDIAGEEWVAEQGTKKVCSHRRVPGRQPRLYMVLRQASQVRCVDGSGAILPVTIQRIITNDNVMKEN